MIATREFPYEEKNLIQAKRYSSTLSGPELREYVALTQRADVDLVIVVSTSGFTNQAKQEAEEYNIKLVNGKTLTQMLIDNNVVDLVRDYTDEIESTEIQTKKPPNPLDSSYTRDIQATVGEGESLSIEIVGYDNKIINFIGNEGNTIYYNEDHPDETSIECTIICLHVENKSSANWKFASEPGFSVIDKNGFSHDRPEQLHNRRQKPLSPWEDVSHSTISRNSKSRVALFYRDVFVPQKLQYEDRVCSATESWTDDDGPAWGEYEKITVLIDDSIRDELNSLPESLSLDSAYFGQI